jgi:23S rRNA (guanosine2251-2'-O)-methyltransferase
MAKERHDIRLQRLIEDCRRLGVPVKFLHAHRTRRDGWPPRIREWSPSLRRSNTAISTMSSPLSAGAIRSSSCSMAWKIRTIWARSFAPPTPLARTAWSFPERRAAPDTGTVTKTSAGASEHLPIAKVTNIARTVEELKERNIWTVGLDERSKQTYDALDYNMDCALVLGGEGKGLHDLVKKKVRLPGFDSDAGQSAVAECVGCGGGRDV